MPKTDPIVAADVEAAPEPTPVKDALDKTGGPQFVIDQMADALERACIEAKGRTNDLSIRWGHEPQNEISEGEDPAADNVYDRRFWIVRDGTEPQGGLTVDEAKAALDAIGVEA